MSFYTYKGFRIDDRRKSPGFRCWKIRHSGGNSYVALDFGSLKAAKAFLDSKGKN